jgi:hypothetical protein
MRDEVGVLIGLTYLVSNFPLSKGWTAFLTGVLHSSSHRPNSISLQWDQDAFLFPGPPWSRTYGLEAWKQNSSSNMSESQFLQNDLAAVPFTLTIIRSPESPQ